MEHVTTDVLVIGAGSIGISCAYFLKQQQSSLRVVLVDSVSPLSFTSAQSGENYRNWWPHPIMKAFMDRSIALMDDIAAVTDNRINLSRRGYLLATRDKSPRALLDNLSDTFTESDLVRRHTNDTRYESTLRSVYDQSLDGVDILDSPALISRCHPYFANDIATLIHIRRGGRVDAQQLGSYMLEEFKSSGGRYIQGSVTSIDQGSAFDVEVALSDSVSRVSAASVVNAAGPFAGEIAQMVSAELPVVNVLHQKIAFEDTKAVIDRTMPFAIDLDAQQLDWSEEERSILAQDTDGQRWLETLPGSIHCRPDGSNWIKLGWAFNETPSKPVRQPMLDDVYPEIVLRGAARLNPKLSQYYDGFPRNFRHYGGYYTMTEENWPLIGESDVAGFYVATAMSGFGTMAACATGELIAHWVLGTDKPEYADGLSLQRYQDERLMSEIAGLQSRGIL